jgi:periplasmic protein TonB
MSKMNVFNRDWCEIVFEGRNQAYGAYQLRKEYARNVIAAIFFTVLL